MIHQADGKVVNDYQIVNLAGALSEAQKRTLARLTGHRTRSREQLGARRETICVLLRYRLITCVGPDYRRTQLGDLVTRQLRAHLVLVK